MRAQRGFTLIETLIAMIILAGALIVLGNSWSGSLGALGRSRQLTTLSFLLQKKMTEFEVKFKDKPAEIPEEAEGDFGEGYEAFSWKMKSKKLEIPDLSAGLTARAGGATEMELMIIKQLTEMIEKAVRELQVTVIWKRDKKEIKHSLTTYLVEYSKDEVSLGK